jgi:hypothetical protein
MEEAVAEAKMPLTILALTTPMTVLGISNSTVSDTTAGNHPISESQLPIDMQFNDGHLLSIIVYSILLIFSAIGNLSVLITIIK